MLEAITNPNLLRARTTINKTLFALIAEYRTLQNDKPVDTPTQISKTDQFSFGRMNSHRNSIRSKQRKQAR
jgi:hypothetical protein